MKPPAPKGKAPSAPLQEIYLLHNFDERILFTAGDRKTDYKSFNKALMTQQYLARRSNSNLCRRRKTSVLRVEGPKAEKTNT